MSAGKMTCMCCGQTRQWPDGFPDHMDARCWDCAWKEHLRTKHPRVVRAARRRAEKMARIKFRNESHREVEAELRREGLSLVPQFDGERRLDPLAYEHLSTNPDRSERPQSA